MAKTDIDRTRDYLRRTLKLSNPRGIKDEKVEAVIQIVNMKIANAVITAFDELNLIEREDECPM